MMDAEVRRNNRFERFGVGPVEQPDAAEGQPSTMARAWELPEASRRGSMTPFSPIWDEIAGARGLTGGTLSPKAKERRLSLWMRRFSQQCHT